MPVQFSIIIPTYNSAAMLRALLASLQQQTADGFEVIVADDASTDDTADVVRDFAVRYERMPVNGGPAAARNHAAALAQGKWLVFTDADTEFLPGTMAEIAALVARVPEGDAFVGSYAGKPANAGFVPQYKALWEYCTIDLEVRADARGVEPYFAWAPRPGLVRKAAFEAIGGFNTGFTGADLEDVELGYRLVDAGFRIFIAPGVRIRHNYPATARKELTAFARRSAIWMRLRKQRPKLDSRGESSPRSALAHLVGFGAFWLVLGVVLFPVLGLLGLGALLVYCGLNGPFLRRAWSEGGAGFAAGCALYCWAHSIVLGFAAAYGLATPHRGVS